MAGRALLGALIDIGANKPIPGEARATGAAERSEGVGADGVRATVVGSQQALVDVLTPSARCSIFALAGEAPRIVNTVRDGERAIMSSLGTLVNIGAGESVA